MQIKTLEEAISVTMKKYNYNENQKRQIYEELEKGNFSVITSDYGAREFVKNYYNGLNAKRVQQFQKSPFEDFSSLTKYFDQLLKSKQLSKDDQNSFMMLFQEILSNLNNQDQQEQVKRLLIEAADLYSKQARNYAEPLRNYDFSTPNITRKEACDITSIFYNMEHQKDKVYNAIYMYPNYTNVLINNLITYSYYEHNYGTSLEEQIEQSKSSYK